MATLVRRHAVVLVETIEELIDTAEILARFPRPPDAGAAVDHQFRCLQGLRARFLRGDRARAATPSADDARRGCENVAARLRRDRQSARHDRPDHQGARVSSPMRPRTLLADPAVGSLIVSIVPGRAAAGHGQGRGAAAAAHRDRQAGRGRGAWATRRRCRRNSCRHSATKGVPVFRSPERALRAMAHATPMDGGSQPAPRRPRHRGAAARAATRRRSRIRRQGGAGRARHSGAARRARRTISRGAEDRRGHRLSGGAQGAVARRSPTRAMSAA